MPSSLKRLVPLATVAGLLAAAPAQAPAQSGGTTPSSTPTTTAPGNPCTDPGQQPRLRCPDLVMYTPYGRHFERVGSRIRYRAGNSIVNVGRGPAQMAGVRTGPGVMRASQRIRGEDGSLFSFPSRGRIVFKPIPFLGGFWKFENAARFELWTVDFQGRLLGRVRTGPKLVYCLRDLTKRFYNVFSPRLRFFPACNQDPGRGGVTLGTSVGWSDDYPSSYYEQWIDVTGLRGRFVFLQRVDPLNHIHESNESNNMSSRIFLRLPPSSAVRSGRAGY